MRIDITKRTGQHDPVTTGKHILAKPRACFEFETLQSGLARIVDHTAEGGQSANGTCDRTGNLYVLIVGVEAGESKVERAVEQAALVADFIAVHFFRIEAEEGGNFAVARDTTGVGGRSVHTDSARIESAAFEAL